MSYEQFVIRSVRQQRTPRTASEAYRDAEYASAIHYPPPSHKTASEVFMGFVATLGAVAMFAYMIFSYLDAIPK